MVGEVSPELLEDVEGNIGEFERAVARAEKLSKVAREASEISKRASEEAVLHADKISRESKEAAETAARTAQEAVDRG